MAGGSIFPRGGKTFLIFFSNPSFCGKKGIPGEGKAISAANRPTLEGQFFLKRCLGLSGHREAQKKVCCSMLSPEFLEAIGRDSELRLTAPLVVGCWRNAVGTRQLVQQAQRSCAAGLSKDQSIRECLPCIAISGALRRVLRRVLETAFEKVLRRVLRRCLAVCFTRREGSEGA